MVALVREGTHEEHLRKVPIFTPSVRAFIPHTPNVISTR